MGCQFLQGGLDVWGSQLLGEAGLADWEERSVNVRKSTGVGLGEDT